MAAADTARLIASLELKNKLGPGLASANKDLGKLETRAFKVGQNIGTGIKNAGKIAAVGIAALASQVALGLDSLVELEKAEAQTGAVLKSTGQAAGINGKQVTALAEKYEALNATIGDEFIRGAENMILTFTNIRGKAFEPALEAVLNLNTAMGKGPEGLTKTAILVGKALNDPAKGLTALTRVGVAFTKTQVEKIKSLQKEGKLYEAQKIVIAELNKEFGGSFLAQGGTTAGKVAKFTDSIDDLQRALATALLPALGNVADALSETLSDPAVIKGAEDLGREIGQLFSKDNIGRAGKVISDVFSAIKGALPGVKSVLQTVAGVVKGAVDAFKSLPPELQKLIVGGLAVEKLTGGLVSNLAGGLISAVLKQLVSGVVNVNGAVVNVNGAGGIPGVGGAAGAGAAGAGGIGAGAIAAGAVGALAIGFAQEASKEAAKSFNEEFGKAGIITDFKGAMVGPQGVIPAIQNIAEVIRVLGVLNKPIIEDRSPGEHTGAAGVVAATGKQKDSVTKQVNAIEKVRGAIEIAHHDTVNKQNAAIERLRSGIGASLGNLKTVTASAGIATAVAAKNAGATAAAASNGVARAVDRKDLSVDVRTNVNVSTSVSVRDLGKTIVRNTRYGVTREIL